MLLGVRIGGNKQIINNEQVDRYSRLVHVTSFQLRQLSLHLSYIANLISVKYQISIPSIHPSIHS